MRNDAIALTLIMILASLTGCLGEDAVDIEEDPNDPNPTGDIGFMDNSSVYGFRFNGTTLERVMVITEDACDLLIAEAAANTEADYDIHWDSTENVCFGWIAFESASHPNEIHVYDLQEEEVCYFKGDTQEFCFPIKVSGRVMWFDSMGSSIMGSDGSSEGAHPGHCGIYIESERLTLPGPIAIGEEAIDDVTLDWNQNVLDLMADQQYIDWDLERMNAYAQESANAPSWCTEPVFSEYWWASQSAESSNSGPGSTISVTVNDHADAITTGGNDNLYLLELDGADADITISNLEIELEDGNGNVHELAGNILIDSQTGTDDSLWEIGETITLIENGVDISGDGSTQATFTIRVIDDGTIYEIGQFTLE